jgi:hypothetical protein
MERGLGIHITKKKHQTSLASVSSLVLKVIQKILLQLVDGGWVKELIVRSEEQRRGVPYPLNPESRSYQPFFVGFHRDRRKN